MLLNYAQALDSILGLEKLVHYDYYSENKSDNLDRTKENMLSARRLNDLRQSKVLVLNHVFNPTNLYY